MLYAAIDMQQKKVTDIILGGEAGHLFQELIDLYNRMTGESRTSFSSLDEAKRMCIQAVHARYFPESVAKPAPQQTAPVTPARTMPPVPAPVAQTSGHITPPWARSDTQNGTNPNPPAQAKPAAPQPQAQGSPPVEAHPEEQEHKTQREQQSTGPVARARMVFETMAGAPRKDVIDACAKLGIKRSTAQTQYQAWKKARETITDDRNPNTGMPQLAPGTYLGNGNDARH